MKREKFGSRLGFILVSAGCAIGIGNVWKFPYLCGQMGGAAFILIYLVFLLIMGVPVMICEFAIGRGSHFSVAAAFEKLEPEGTRWHISKWIGILGSYLLMMFYTSVGGWMMYYCFRSIRGDFVGNSAEEVGAKFTKMLADAPNMAFWTILICVIGFAICWFGIQNGIEKVSKVMMSVLMVLMIILAVHSVFLKGAGAGIRFYLIPDFRKMAEIGIGNVIFGAMSQAFFTLSIGIGAMMIFGSYLERNRSLAGEALSITGLDTFVALMAGFIIIPACFAFGIEPGAGPSLIFITIPNIFSQMLGGQVWGALFFLFLTFAAFTTLVAVFENIISFSIDMFGTEAKPLSRKKAAIINGIIVLIASLPCVLGYNIWSDLHLIGGRDVLDSEDFIVSNLLLPAGSRIYLLFCVTKFGWGFDHYYEECNTGSGIRLSRKLKPYFQFILPILILIILIQGLM